MVDEGVQLVLALPGGFLDASPVLPDRALPLFDFVLSAFALQLCVPLGDQSRHFSPEGLDAGDDIGQAREQSRLPTFLPVFGQFDAAVRRIGHQAQFAGWAVPGDRPCIGCMAGATLRSDVVDVAHVGAVADIAQQGRHGYFDECQAHHLSVDMDHGQALGRPRSVVRVVLLLLDRLLSGPERKPAGRPVVAVDQADTVSIGFKRQEQRIGKGQCMLQACLTGLTSTVEPGTADLDVLEAVVVQLETRLQRARRSLPPAKKARLIKLMFLYFRDKPEIDSEHVSEMLALTA